MPRGIDYLHYADLYQVTQILSLSGAYEKQFSVRGTLVEYCQADRPDERLAGILNRCWIDRSFARRLLDEIVGTLENLDGATDDTRFAGPRQTSFSAYAASQSASLGLDYIDVRNKWLERLNNRKRWEARKTGNHQQAGQQSTQQSGSKDQKPS
ncbi:hypothetical protein E6O75_ATG01918 [Venturia nashicola]|uniref:Uncharacterized protein n=1 Tax=Venturia nashicola TaxID=86259 RepID=A0A4Z1PL19_9PEZI|nr:hypothetical protein E6O75_ATG01918 [Venturia nashicola]